MPRTARIALNRPLRRLFDYQIPAGMEPIPGQRVRVPFGHQTLTGLVVETDAPPPEGISLRPIGQLLEPWPVLPEETFRLLSWASRYYQHPLGECLFTALPPALRRGRPAEEKKESWWQAATSPQDLPANAHRQRALLQWLQQQNGPASTQAIINAGFTRAQIRALADKQRILPVTGPENGNAPEPETVPRLTQAQEQAACQLATPDTGFQVSLLYGVTGSGKTEIYIHYLKTHLPRNRQALVLVPEINLTPQTVARFRRYFGDRIGVWHSALNDAQRLQVWLRVRRGEPVILIGTRSAALLPFTGLGAIVVDEEHDTSYKQGEGFRYSARDLAVYRANLNQCPVILGSATPSLESFHNARRGRYHLIRLEERAGASRPPQLQLLDIRSRPLEGGLSRPALQAIGQTLARGEQVLVFVNRRGYAPVMMCFDCGHMEECPRCDTRLTYHRQGRALRCHHCDFQKAASSECPACHSDNFKPVGQGTERTEETLTRHFPDVPVVRVDRDSTQRKGRIQSILDTVNSGAPCILVGTQMLAKGHDFPKVTLVTVVNADGGLFSVDFRAPEQMLQTLLQVSGRAGRGDRPGKVLIQPCHSDHPLLTALCRGRYLELAEQLLAERENSGLPPFRAMAILWAEADRMEHSLKLLDSVAPLAQGPDLHLWGPLPALIPRRADRYRAQLVFSAGSRQQLNRVLAGICQYLDQTRPPPGSRWMLDVDPQETG
ncbi:MAG: primosomal protein N' [Euryarchaeota archaeon]|nr:primosomal protein N' [Marinobacter sp.]